MGLKDLIVTPFYIIIISVIAYRVRPYVTNKQTRKYFLPALWVRMIGAIALGLIYQFYYEGGDTFNYWKHGSQWIWNAFLSDPRVAFEMIFGPNHYTANNFAFAQHVWFLTDSDSYFVIRVAGMFDILTLGTYSATGVLFAFYSWSGSWAFFNKVNSRYPEHLSKLSLAILFIPSMVFWGSGLLKDSLSLGSFCWLVYSFIGIANTGKLKVKYVIILGISSLLLINIKPYVFYCSIPPVAMWIYMVQIKKIKSLVFRTLAAPVVLIFFILFSYLSIEFLTKENAYYSLDNIAERAWITAYDIRYYTGKSAGSGYSLGEQDGTIESMLKLMPGAIFVSLYRPFFWEVNNPLMLLMALESFVFLILTIRFFGRNVIRSSLRDPFLIFCLTFTILFGFAVGVSTYNFGTLMRYKIPMLALFLIYVIVPQRSKNVGLSIQLKK